MEDPAVGSGRGGGGGGAAYQYFKVSRQQARAGGRDDTECTAGLQHCSPCTEWKWSNKYTNITQY